MPKTCTWQSTHALFEQMKFGHLMCLSHLPASDPSHPLQQRRGQLVHGASCNTEHGSQELMFTHILQTVNNRCSIIYLMVAKVARGRGLFNSALQKPFVACVLPKPVPGRLVKELYRSPSRVILYPWAPHRYSNTSLQQWCENNAATIRTESCVQAGCAGVVSVAISASSLLLGR